MIDRIKEIRQKVFKTQAAFAKALNVSPQATSAYENGEAVFKFDKLLILCNDYNININWLLTGKGQMTLDNETNIIINDKIESLNKELDRLKIENAILKELLKKN